MKLSERDDFRPVKEFDDLGHFKGTSYLHTSEDFKIVPLNIPESDTMVTEYELWRADASSTWSWRKMDRFETVSEAIDQMKAEAAKSK